MINAIGKQEADKAALLRLDYPRDLWMEKEIRSVANVTRQDVREFLALAAAARIRPTVQAFPLAEANTALQQLRSGAVRGRRCCGSVREHTVSPEVEGCADGQPRSRAFSVSCSSA